MQWNMNDHMHNKIIRKTIHNIQKQIIIMFHSKLEPVQKMHNVHVIQAVLKAWHTFLQNYQPTVPSLPSERKNSLPYYIPNHSIYNNLQDKSWYQPLRNRILFLNLQHIWNGCSGIIYSDLSIIQGINLFESRIFPAP